ncbi:sigma-E factor regulatory protein RseB domain-containing protein [Micromonospora soli]|uniref:LolA family protein n=1 Tax=Micromonospora sp. NBRC 110009 TaxID=3061627 RepID=UPI002673C794|nr:sigma-E factor regulatory protein RseB domain-containing protein [Micromonospora sp. NBRC 110009]WKT99311.1 sigma-E factor regulatory protein RseB domain-containing protein [Micromonospora sp. NBRC 110009]
MSVLKNRAVLRWLVPATAGVAVVGGGAAIGTFAAADPALPPRTAAQLLEDLRTSRLDGLSGTVVQRADLGLPPIADLAGAAGGDELTSLITGTHTLRVWYAGPDRQRLALVDTLGERDVLRNGRDVWTWSSRTNTASHRTLPADAAAPPSAPATPADAADRALAAIDPSTAVTVGRSATVAGRSVYELVLTPRDKDSLVHQVRIALDAKEHVPLRFEVLADGVDEPAFEVAFTQVDFRTPDADQFRFNPPPGVTVTEQRGDGPAGKHLPDADLGKPGADRGKDAPDVRTVGTGWTTVLVAKLDAAGGAARGAKPAGGADAAGADAIAKVLGGLPKVSGDWGSGRLLTGKLFSVLLTDDGRVFAGLVTPERLYQAARG